MSIALSRRAFLKSSALLSAGLSIQALVPTLSRAATLNTRLLMINLNGGLDGLAALQPKAGEVYNTLSSMRPTLALGADSLLSANNLFGFHPNLTLFKALYDQGSLSSVLNLGYKNMSRSHLDAEIAVTRGVADRYSTTSSGLLNRLGATQGWSNMRAVSVTGADPIFAGGDYQPLQANSLDDLYFRSADSNYSNLDHLVNSTYSFAVDSVDSASPAAQQHYLKSFKTVVESTDIVQEAVKSASFGATYPGSYLGRALRSAEIAMGSAQMNAQVVYLRRGGFDTHSNQKSALEALFTEMDAALTVFVANMKGRGLWNDLVVLVFSEFGRTNVENGSGGTDHGGANPVFLFGGKVAGGNIIGETNKSDLTDIGWLPAKYNFAELYRQILLGMDIDPNQVVPAAEGAPLAGLLK